MITRRTALEALDAPLLSAQVPNRVELLGVYDVNLSGPRGGNPFVDVRVERDRTFLTHASVQGDDALAPAGTWSGKFQFKLPGRVAAYRVNVAPAAGS